MKKSEKVKGKERVAVEKKRNLKIAVAAVVVILIAAATWYFFFNPSVARAGDTVAIYYTGTLDNGTVVESNQNLDLDPFVFTIGKEEIIPYGLPDAVIGMHLNETRIAVLSPERAFGPYDPSLIQQVNRSSIPPDANLTVGQDYEIVRKADNAIAHVRITNLTPDKVTWDGNRPFAGQNLTLDITLVQILRK
jgi:peptidylprolyl isomerase